MAKVLIVEDEQEMAIGLRDNFEFDGHEVIIAYDGETGLQMALEEKPQLMILDVMLPKKSGLDVLKELRAKEFNQPIIMLTARGQEIDKVLGLELGADDYITKPFSVRELLARAKAVLRRSANDTFQTKHKMGKLTLNFDHYVANDENGDVELGLKEFEILQFLLEHKGQTISRDQLLNKVWGYDVYPTSRTVDNHIVKLRKKVEENPARPKHILSVHGIGYKYIE